MPNAIFWESKKVMMLVINLITSADNWSFTLFNLDKAYFKIHSKNYSQQSFKTQPGIHRELL